MKIFLFVLIAAFLFYKNVWLFNYISGEQKEILVSTDQLIVLGSKREWVPMWLWMNVVFRFKLYEIWPLCYIFYVCSPRS